MEYRLMLKPIRRTKGMTQSQLAQLVGVSERKLASWERGETHILLEDAFKCAIALECDVNDLCGWPKGKNEGRTFDDSYEQELVECYRDSTQQRKASILQTARDAAGMSREVPESSVSQSEVRTA